MPTKFVFHRKRAEEIFPLVISWLKGNKGLYQEANYSIAPQNRCIPKGVSRGSLGHLIFLYFTTVNTYREDSDKTFRNMLRMWDEYPNAFTQDMPDEKVLSGLLQEKGFYHYNAAARNWYRSGQALFSRFDGDPRNLFFVKSVDEFKKYRNRLRKENNGLHVLCGFGPKIYSLLNIFYYEVGAVDLLPDAFPVDRHVMRQFRAWGIITGNGVHNAATDVAETIRKESVRILRKINENAFTASHAFWLLGAFGCKTCDRLEGIEYLCPAYEHCKGASDVERYATKGQWDFDDPSLRNKGPLQKPLIHEGLAIIAVHHGGNKKIKRVKEIQSSVDCADVMCDNLDFGF